jgi:ribose-phosphate pyrophosphokinase
MRDGAPLVFALGRERPLAERLVAELGVALAEHEERAFEDGEQALRPLVTVRGRDVYVLDSLVAEPGTSPHDKLCRLLFFLAALRDAGAARVTAVVPYLCYARQERRTAPRGAVASRYVAQLLEAAGVDRVVAVDVHDVAAYENAFRCPAEHLEARPLLVADLVPLLGERPVAVVSPDTGGFRRAERFRRTLERALDRATAMVFLEKVRTETGIVGGAVVGDVDGRVAVIVDDLVATGATVMRAARACRERGATAVVVAATHGLFTRGVGELLAAARPERIVVTDSVPLSDGATEAAHDRLRVVSLAPLLAAAIERLHDETSLAGLSELGAMPAAGFPAIAGEGRT